MESIFSTYSTGENRVTASFLAVLRCLSLGRIQKILGALLEQSEFELVRFENQPSKGGAGVPDAVILSSVRIFIETKTARNAVQAQQIKRHLERLDNAKEQTAILLVITPDDSRPIILESIDDRRVAWTSFAALDQAIDELLDDKYEVVSERESFLLRELQNMLTAEQLIASASDVVVVAARNAWPEYNQFHAYVCQPKRPFQSAGRIGFYSKGQVYPLVPKILKTHEEIVMETGQPGELGALMTYLLDKKLRNEGESYKVVFLSPPESPETLRLAKPIINDMRSTSGKVTAFTMGQRYVSSAALMKANTTSDLARSST
jgi:hypothetical protein